MASNNIINHYELDVVESEYDYADTDLKKKNQDDIFYDDIAPVSTIPSLQPNGIHGPAKETGKLSTSVISEIIS